VPRYLELGHVIADGMPTYPGLPSPRVRPHLGHAQSRGHYDGAAEFEISRFEMVGNVGTYLDSPYHRYPDRDDIAALPLERLVDLEIVVIDAPALPGPVAVELPAVGGRAVLVRTGWSRRWGTAGYWQPGPFLSDGLVRSLVDGGAALVGVDFWNVDDTTNPARPAHTELLGAGIPIVEHMCDLDALPAAGASLWILPLRIESAASVPVRPIAVARAS
jgi:arylformamidase